MPISPPSSRHAIVVLGCPVASNGRPTPGLLRRLERGLEAAQNDRDAWVVTTGAAVKNEFPEGPSMRDWFIAHGLPASRVTAEAKARFTLDNAENVATMLRGTNVSQLTLVTERFHMTRAKTLFRHALQDRGMNVQIVELPAEDGLQGEALRQRGMREAAALMRDCMMQSFRSEAFNRVESPKAE